MNVYHLCFVYSVSVSLLANLPEDKLSKIVDCLEVVSYSVKLSIFLSFHYITSVLHNSLAAHGGQSVADSCCQNIITSWPYTITACQHILSTSSQQDLTNYLVDEQSRYYSCHRWALYIVTRIIWPRPQKVFIQMGDEWCLKDVQVTAIRCKNMQVYKSGACECSSKHAGDWVTPLLVSSGSKAAFLSIFFTMRTSRMFLENAGHPTTSPYRRTSLFSNFWWIWFCRLARGELGWGGGVEFNVLI